jgi:hypothetical protein
VKPVSTADRFPPSTACSLQQVSYSQSEAQKPLFSASPYTCSKRKRRKSNQTSKKPKPFFTQQIQNFEIPSILKPNLNLLGFNVGQNRILLNQLLPTHGTWLGAFHVNLFQSFNLFSSVPHIFPRIINVLELNRKLNS